MKDLDKNDQHYFDSYDHFSIHEEMLKDRVRTLAYRDAIMRNRDLFKDKVVLDVGCGSGILSMFAARAGAKKVIGVDRSQIIHMARKIVEVNGLSDTITLIQGQMEEVKLPVPKVDIIISEWMGYFLLFESMLDTVLYARDHYLVEGGLILPDRTTLLMAAIEDAEYKDEKVGYWDDVYGFDYTPFKDIVTEEPIVDIVESKAVISNSVEIGSIDLYTVKKEDLAYRHRFDLTFDRSDTCHALVSWFDIDFAQRLPNPVSFSTGPFDKPTHWKQTVVYTPTELQVNAGDRLVGEIHIAPNSRNPRNIDIGLAYTFTPQNRGPDAMELTNYVMR
ncbi:Protein arginine N-methyltransferase 1 [Wickerhamiella sorbophila]|uniref:type I protein arginine methyltransferase n=1 Tax=Wickerhamiella sorbophila TaxID=45607 RepID=A0A2T0FCQ5_9ASCO|nr:Protein arginine N-methyltransferase 1 [Wickerhamiella sorbophila]PRT52761.1 Protein arginine N-methyltransferase 1 [Wickerhamiella sorbophila]